MIEQIRTTARSYFDDAQPAHDWYHVERVEELSETLMAAYEDTDKLTLRAAVLLHDIGRAKEGREEISNHAIWGAEESAEILKRHDADSRIIDAVSHCIKSHSLRTNTEPTTIEAKILWDADNLDMLGAIGLARSFCHGGELNIPIYNPNLPVEDDESEVGETLINRLEMTIIDVSDRMYTERGEQLAKERRHFTEQFIDRFKKEVTGEI